MMKVYEKLLKSPYTTQDYHIQLHVPKVRETELSGGTSLIIDHKKCLLVQSEFKIRK